MSDFTLWNKNIHERLDDLQEQLAAGPSSSSSPSPQTPYTPPSLLFQEPLSPPFTSPTPFAINPLFDEDPEFKLLDSPVVFGVLNFDLPDPPIKMTSLREENGQVQGNQEGGRPSNITYPAVAEGKTSDFDLRGGFFHQLPKFYGLSNEDPNQHLQQFEFCCETMCPRGADIQHAKMRAFPHSLEDRARTWFFAIPAGRMVSTSRRKASLLKVLRTD